MSPLKLIGLGAALLLASWAVIFLMVLGVIGKSFPVALGAYAASLAGFMLGMFGVVNYVRARRVP